MAGKDSNTPFRWLSPFGIASALFLVHGVLTAVIGVLSLFLFHLPAIGSSTRMAETGGIILSGRMDSQYFGRPLGDFVREHREMVQVVDLLMDVRAGLWTSFGICETALVWFGMRQRQPWAFWTVALANLGSLAGWVSIALQFARRGVTLGLDLPPVVFLYAAITTPVATILGWLGLRRE